MRNIFVRFFYAFLVKPWLTYIVGVSFKNTEVFKGLDKFIIVANHNSHFDTVSIMAGLPAKKRQHTCAVAARDYFGKTSVSGWLMKLFFNAVLINRNRKEGEPSSIEILDGKLKEGKSIIIFPEGSRGSPGAISNFKKGVAILLKKNPTVPFIPVYLDGFGRVLPKDSLLIIPLICKVRFGAPLFSSNENIELTLEEVKEAILKLKQKDERDRNQFELT